MNIFTVQSTLMRALTIICLLFSQLGLGQNIGYQLTSKDTLNTFSLSKSSSITGPMLETHASDFENLIVTIFKALPFPAQPFTMIRANSPESIQIGKHSYDELEHHTFLIYNIDSVSLLNLKAKTRFASLANIAHLAGHHGFNHFKAWPDDNLKNKILRSDYMAGWLMAKFNVPATDANKTLNALIAAEGSSNEFPSLKERNNAISLGYQVATESVKSPLASIENTGSIESGWLQQWGRKIEAPQYLIELEGATCASLPLALDRQGQLIYTANGQSVVIGRCMPSKDSRYAYLLYDNTFHYWLIRKDGTISNASMDRELGHVDISNLLDASH